MQPGIVTEMVAKHWHNKCAHRGCTVARNAELFYPIGILETQLRPLWNITHPKCRSLLQIKNHPANGGGSCYENLVSNHALKQHDCIS